MIMSVSTFKTVNVLYLYRFYTFVCDTVSYINFTLLFLLIRCLKKELVFHCRTLNEAIQVFDISWELYVLARYGTAVCIIGFRLWVCKAAVNNFSSYIVTISVIDGESGIPGGKNNICKLLTHFIADTAPKPGTKFGVLSGYSCKFKNYMNTLILKDDPYKIATAKIASNNKQ